MASRASRGKVPTTVNSSVGRAREYLTGPEIEKLMAAARKYGRYGHRDATMILITYRHGLRASEVCDLQWHQVELGAGRLHVRRPSGVHLAFTRCRGTRSGRYAVCNVNNRQGRMSSLLSGAGR